jgi:Uma2 family endonuclease
MMQTPLVFEEGRKDNITNPVMIAEVLSNSTKSYDKDEKFAAYRTIYTFQEYILIDQYTMHVEQYSKTDNNKWIFSEYSDSHDSLNLAAIACQILLEDIYYRGC